MTPDSQEILDTLDAANLPRHVAIIMDGNGRWAKNRGLDRSVGHAEGVKSVRLASELASDLGIGYLTLYAFSTENWNRPQAEVEALMHLIGWAIANETPDMVANNVRLNLAGDLARIPPEPMARLNESLLATAHCNGLVMTLCISYSGRSELTHSVRSMAAEAASGTLDPAAIDESTVESHLHTKGMPDPDLLIRTGGEYRISNFLLWQAAYAELYFTPVLWPDFGKKEFGRALQEYQHRERRYGKTGDQIRQTPPLS